MADSTVRGRFVWHELITTDVAGAVAFYKKVVGWKTQPWDKDSSYLMWVSKSGPIGGVAKLSETAVSAQPYWLPYIATTDIEATVNDAGRLGGKVLVPVTDIPNGGRYAVIADPQGASFGVYASAQTTAPGKPVMGDFSWHELATSDYQAAFSFYQTLFGWEKTGEHDMGDMGMYFMYGLNGQPLGGMYNKRHEMPTHWLGYAQVKSADVAAKAAAKAGGKVMMEPMQVPGGSWISIMSDPQGAVSAVVTEMQPQTQEEHQPAEMTAAPAKAKTKSAPAKKKAKKTAKKKLAAKAKQAPVKKSAKKAGKKTSKKKGSAKATKKKAPVKASKKKSAKKKVVAKRALKNKAAKKTSKKKLARKKK